ncbi:hypothetical protein D1007_10225 [Hordeum vulgare]|nr:hypothetical protein D1007_10225 [Hordeum vulgare]
MRLATLNDISWNFLDATVGAFDKDYEVISKCARAYLNLKVSRLVPEQLRETKGSIEVYNRDVGPTLKGFDARFGLLAYGEIISP